MRLQQPKQGAFQYAHTHDVAWMSQNTNHIHTYKEIKEAIMKIPVAASCGVFE